MGPLGREVSMVGLGFHGWSPSGFPCVISDPPVSQERESHKVTGSILLQEEHFGINKKQIRVHLFHPTWRNEGSVEVSFLSKLEKSYPLMVTVLKTIPFFLC